MPGGCQQECPSARRLGAAPSLLSLSPACAATARVWPRRRVSGSSWRQSVDAGGFGSGRCALSLQRHVAGVDDGSSPGANARRGNEASGQRNLPLYVVKVLVTPQRPNMSIARGARSISSAARCIFCLCCIPFFTTAALRSARVHPLSFALRPSPSSPAIHAPYLLIILLFIPIAASRTPFDTRTRSPIGPELLHAQPSLPIHSPSILTRARVYIPPSLATFAHYTVVPAYLSYYMSASALSS